MCDRDKMAALNEGTFSDLVELEGDEESGSDVHIEVKVPSPLTKSAKQKGRGTNKHGGMHTSNGHLYAHGNTDEPFRIGILGVRRKGLILSYLFYITDTS